MKNFSKFAVLGAALAVSASLTATAHATSVSGEVWEGATSYPSALSSTPPAGTGSTFTVNGTGNLFNFVSGSSNNLILDPTYTLGGFLTSGGDTLSSVVLASGVTLGDSINNDVFEFTGVTVLTAGTTYTINHDDGMYLFLTPAGGGSTVTAINSPNPTASIPGSFTVGTTGAYNFEILYAEVNGAPAVLGGTLGTLASPVPEPNSLVLLGTGLMSAAGMLFRRIRTA